MSAEAPIYRAGRQRGIDLLRLTAGDQVLDIGCGTGLNFPLLQEKISTSGTIVGIDRSAAMLQQARRRAHRSGWQNVILIEADATTLTLSDVVASITAAGGRALSDAVLATYALSLMPEWEQSWACMKALLKPGGRAGVVDMQRPVGRYSVLTPLALVACRLGGADIDAHPWTAVERDCSDIIHASVRGGHLQIRVGTR